MIDRRSLLMGVPAAFFATMVRPAFADIGTSAGLDVIKAVQALPGVVEGHGRGTLYILYAPWCVEVPALYETTRGFLDQMAFKWIPFSGNQPEGKVGIERLLSGGSPADIPRSFQMIVPGKKVNQSFASADAQDARVLSAIRLIERDTGRGMATPTLVYRMDGDRVRIHPGGVTANGLRELSNYIA
jgi:hypothetical protein